MSRKGSTPVGQVRNILANELGLSREAVLEIVERRVDKILDATDIDSLIRKTTERCIEQMAKGSGRDYVSIRTIAADQAAKIIREQLIINIMKPGTGDFS